MADRQQVFARLIADIFSGGRGYKTVKGKKTPFPFATVLLTLLITALLLGITFTLIRISEVSSDIAELKIRLVTLTAKEEKLQDERNHKYSYLDILDTAGELGLSADNGQVVVIPPQGTEEIP